MGNKKEFAIFQDPSGSYYYASAEVVNTDILVRREIYDPNEAFELVKKMNKDPRKK